MRRVATAGALLAIGAALGGGGAYAGTVITSSQIKNGTIRLADLSPPTIRALRGKAGPTGRDGKVGPAGAMGATGLAGATGPAGVSQLQLVTGTTSPTSSTAVATCPAGKRVIGGGATNYGVSLVPSLRQNAPAADLSAWFVRAESGGHVGDEVTAYAICAVVGP
jgi:hypothetical protein